MSKMSEGGVRERNRLAAFSAQGWVKHSAATFMSALCNCWSGQQLDCTDSHIAYALLIPIARTNPPLASRSSMPVDSTQQYCDKVRGCQA